MYKLGCGCWPLMPPVEGRCTERPDGGTDVEGLQKGTIPRWKGRQNSSRELPLDWVAQRKQNRLSQGRDPNPEQDGNLKKLLKWRNNVENRMHQSVGLTISLHVDMKSVASTHQLVKEVSDYVWIVCWQWVTWWNECANSDVHTHREGHRVLLFASNLLQLQQKCSKHSFVFGC